MSFEHPLALLLLAVPAILLWLRTRAARPRAAEASSLLVWQKVSPSDTVPEKPRPPLAAWIEAAGAALLALGMAGPFLPAGGSVDPIILVDGSPSMNALGADGRSRTAAIGLAPHSYRRHWGWDLGTTGKLGIYPVSPGIPELLAAGERVVVVTDHRWPGYPDDPPRLALVGVGSPGFNAGITAAFGDVLAEDRWRIHIVVEAFGLRGPVEGRLAVGSETSAITLVPGRPLELDRVLAPDPGRPSEQVRISFPGDVLPDDDGVSFTRVGGEIVHVVTSEADREAPLVRALIAAGASRTVGREAMDGSLTMECGWSRVQIHFPKPGVGETVQGSRVVGLDHPLAKDVHVDPAATLGVRGGEAIEGVPVMADDRGPLVTLEELDGFRSTMKESTVRFSFMPGGTWVDRDPSFVVLAKNLVEFAGGGPPSIRVCAPDEAMGLKKIVFSSRETREAAEGETFGDLKAAIEEARRPDPASRASYAFVLLMLGGGGLAAAWLAMR